ncbi:MAG: PIN domain-containing protein [Caldilineaceae bacterium]
MLLDTSGLFCLFHAAELQHPQAVSSFDSAEIKVTTNYVLAEFVALADTRRLSRQLALEFVVALPDSTEVTVIYVHDMLHRAAVHLLQQRLDKRWSLCDAVSMVVMNQYGIYEVLTTDHHFEQAGFRRLLTP